MGIRIVRANVEATWCNTELTCVLTPKTMIREYRVNKKA